MDDLFFFLQPNPAHTGATNTDWRLISSTPGPGAWGSIGPTDSGADQEFSEFDAVSLTAKFVVLAYRIAMTADGAGDTSILISVRPTGVSWTEGHGTKGAGVIDMGITADATNENPRQGGILLAPLGSGRTFDIHYARENDLEEIVEIRFMGWI